MATHRVAEIVKSRSDLTDEEIERLTENEAWRWIRDNASSPYRADDEKRWETKTGNSVRLD